MNERLPPHCHSQNSRSFRCACGEVHHWNKGRKQMIECVCGRLHWRNRGGHENRRDAAGRCEGFGSS
jgi:hypothetical protein